MAGQPTGRTAATDRYFVSPDQVPRMAFDWGQLAVTFSAELNGAERCSGGAVVLEPGRGHDRHNHPGTEEIIFVISGIGTQMVEDEQGAPTTVEVGSGTTILVPADRYHSTINTGSEPMRLFVVYVPGGAENALRQLPDFRLLPPARAS